ncbi:conserved hypothetical protein [Ricinus communis]|uniref:Uncharacterized protein n=1 Tax=Ricinus communis TaxID=3988 RepID=B9RDR7_RICCO|nr:conserved hypothetical protein [Ricinus communis]
MLNSTNPLQHVTPSSPKHHQYHPNITTPCNTCIIPHVTDHPSHPDTSPTHQTPIANATQTNGNHGPAAYPSPPVPTTAQPLPHPHPSTTQPLTTGSHVPVPSPLESQTSANHTTPSSSAFNSPSAFDSSTASAYSPTSAVSPTPVQSRPSLHDLPDLNNNLIIDLSVADGRHLLHDDYCKTTTVVLWQQRSDGFCAIAR